MDNVSKVSDFLPLAPQQLYILLSLIDTERHGYGIRKDIEEQTNGQYHIPIASLYRSIDNMEGSGWIEWSSDRPTPQGDDPRRKYYRLTTLGRAVCHAEMLRLQRIVNSPRSMRALDNLPADT